MCVLYSAVALADAAKLRCGSDLLNDLLFVCGDRGVYLGEPTVVLFFFFTKTKIAFHNCNLVIVIWDHSPKTFSTHPDVEGGSGDIF